ncbi:hypothetical protein GEMRC1_000741 [Eukaryota sp. GEM-RC1]
MEIDENGSTESFINNYLPNDREKLSAMLLMNSEEDDFDDYLDEYSQNVPQPDEDQLEEMIAEQSDDDPERITFNMIAGGAKPIENKLECEDILNNNKKH